MNNLKQYIHTYSTTRQLTNGFKPIHRTVQTIFRYLHIKIQACHGWRRSNGICWVCVPDMYEYMCTKAKQYTIPFHMLQPWQVRFVCRASDYFWDSVWGRNNDIWLACWVFLHPFFQFTPLGYILSLIEKCCRKNRCFCKSHKSCLPND